MIEVPEDSASTFCSGSGSLCRYTEDLVAFSNLFHKRNFNALFYFVAAIRKV